MFEVGLSRRSTGAALIFWRGGIPAVPVAKTAVALNTDICVDQWGLATEILKLAHMNARNSIPRLRDLSRMQLLPDKLIFILSGSY